MDKIKVIFQGVEIGFMLDKTINFNDTKEAKIVMDAMYESNLYLSLRQIGKISGGKVTDIKKIEYNVLM